MGALYKVPVLLLCINIFLYVGSNYIVYSSPDSNPQEVVKLKGDLIDLMLEKETLKQDLNTYYSSMQSGGNVTISRTLTINETFKSPPQQKTGSYVGDTASLFLDMPRIIWSFLITLFNMIILPMTLLSIADLPPLFTIFFGLPLVMLQFIAVIVLFRGGGA